MKKSLFACICSFVILLSSCATTINYSVIRPAELDLNGANSISVIPFKPSDVPGIIIKLPNRNQRNVIVDFFRNFFDVRKDEAATIKYLKSQLESGLSKSRYIDLISSDEVERALKNGNASSVVDVYLTGEILGFVIDDEKIVDKKVIEVEETKRPVPQPVTDADSKTDVSKTTKKEVVSEIKYKRNVHLKFVYEIIDSKSEVVICYKEVEIKDSSSEYSNTKQLPEAFDIIKSELNSVIKKILKEVQPYSVDRSLTLLESKDDKDIIEKGVPFVESRNYKAAFDYYARVYETKGIFEAGYNAALVLEADGDLYKARDLMEDVYLNTDNKKNRRKAKAALDDILTEINYDKKLRGQMQNQVDRAVEENDSSC